MAKGVILAAPASGSGKTTVTLGLLRCLARRGVDVIGAKVGPDYIDPGFHAVACGRPSINLDPWAMRRSTIHSLVDRLNAAFIVCEGVMGLFDGAGKDGIAGSTADLAALTGWPVILVVDARGQSGSVGALLQGFARYRSDVTIAGVIFNRVGSERHAAMLENATAHALPDLRLLGSIKQDLTLTLPSRHLGLVLAEEIESLEAFLDAAADKIWRDTKIDEILSFTSQKTIDAAAPAPDLPPLGRRIALARDAAFAFVYPHLIEIWRQSGAEIIPFSPLENEGPCAGADAVFLPGGYPELYAGRLSTATQFMAGLQVAAAQGATLYGECGGYMVLGRALIDAEGESHRMAGLLPIVTSIAKPARRLGYRQARGLAGPWQGLGWRGHEFHFADVIESEGAPPLWSWSNADETEEGLTGHSIGNVSGSFFHIVDRAD